MKRVVAILGDHVTVFSKRKRVYGAQPLAMSLRGWLTRGSKRTKIASECRLRHVVLTLWRKASRLKTGVDDVICSTIRMLVNLALPMSG